jgi:anti-anti-sigma regulatory factor
MAARSKKKSALPQTGQKTQNTVMEDLAITAGSAQESFVINDGEIMADNTGSLSQGFIQSEHLEADDSEVNMNTNAELPDTQSPDKAAEDDAAEPVINLEPTLSIQNVVKLYDKLKKSYAAYDAIEIDASHVTSIDTATLQLFVALKKDAIKQKKEVDFFQPSARFVESARLLDLLDILEIIHV